MGGEDISFRRRRMQRPEGCSSGNCGEIDGTTEVVLGEGHKGPSLLCYGPWSSLETNTITSVFFESSFGSHQGDRLRRLPVLNVPTMSLLFHLPNSFMFNSSMSFSQILSTNILKRIAFRVSELAPELTGKSPEACT